MARPVAKRARALGLHLDALEDFEAAVEAAGGGVRLAFDLDRSFEPRGDEAEDAPGLGDVLLIFDPAPELQRAERGLARLLNPPAAEQRLGEEAVVLGEADVAGGRRQLD